MAGNTTGNIAYYKGGRRGAPSSTPAAAESGDVEDNSNNNSNNSNKLKSFDDDLPEGVDFSEGGWATDMAASLLGFLFFISALRNYSDDNHHFIFLHAGTAIAHFFGGLAHRYYPNRATDGVGMRGFYVTMVLGYGGNCLRYALGWQLSHGGGDILGGSGVLWPLLGVVNFCYLVLAASWTVRRMEKTDQRIDDSDATGFLPEMVYAAGELAVAIGEVVASVLFLLERETTDSFALVAVGSNIVGWVAVYAVGGCAFLTGTDYNPNTMQRIFHYSMMIMIWAINEYATSSDDE